MWDPSAKFKVHDIKLNQNKTIRFLANLKGHDDSVGSARERLKLETMEDGRKNHRLCLLTKILQTEEQHDAFLRDTEEAIGKRPPETMTTRAATKG